MQTSTIKNHPLLFFGWLIFIGITGLVLLQNVQLYFWDRDFLNYLQRFITPDRTVFFKGVALFGSPMITVGLAIIASMFLWQRKMLEEALTTLVVVVTSNAGGLIIKHLIERPRPTTMLAHDSGYSFPSGHVVSAVILLLIVFQFILPLISSVRLRMFFSMMLVFWVALICLSRLYLQVHYPTDVIGAVLYGLLWWESAMAVLHRQQLNTHKVIQHNRGQSS
uniref:phosphatase PAP2 family protein n=1 Tax=Lentilactobacillus hilgardii TaxID=1588 RepID=UPI00403F7E54